MIRKLRCRCLKDEVPHLTAPLLPTICSPAPLEGTAEGRSPRKFWASLPPFQTPMSLLLMREEEKGQGLGLCCIPPPLAACSCSISDRKYHED